MEDGASIGSGAVILPGVVIGANSLIGAGAVVTRDVIASVHCRLSRCPDSTTDKSC